MTKSQTYWKLLKYLPPFIRRKYLRAALEIQSDFPSDFLFKKAESTYEIEQALQILKTACDPQNSLPRFLDLPSTSLFIALWKADVVGAICVTKDGVFGLPSSGQSEVILLRNQGKHLAEVSPLHLKKDFNIHREKLLLALCKAIYLYCTQILKVDAIIASSSPETKFFYTDILLFHPLCDRKPGSFFSGILPMNSELHSRYLSVYGNLPKHRNLLQFLFDTETKCIQMPRQKSQLLRRTKPRVEIQSNAMAFVNGATTPQPCNVLNVSDNGLQVKLEQTHSLILIGQPILVVFEHNQEWITCQATIKWLESQKRIGCAIVEKTHTWKKFTTTIWNENSLYLKAS